MNNTAEYSTATQYTTEQLQILKKAGLIGTGVITLQSKVSRERRILSVDGRNWDATRKGQPPVVDRSRVVDEVAPCVHNNRILGYWRYKVTEDEAKVLIYDLGIPVFQFGRNITDEGGKTEAIADTRFTLHDGKEYDLSDPAQMAEWLVVKETGMIADSEPECWADDWCSFWYTNSETKYTQEAVTVDAKLDFIVVARSLDADIKVQCARLMHYKGYRTIEDMDELTDKMLAIVFDACILTHEKELAECMAIQDKVMQIKMYRLVQQGRIMKFGADGPFHAERTHSGQSRGALIGNTAEEAARNLSMPDFQYLLTFLEGKKNAGKSANTDTMTKILNVNYAKYDAEKAKNMSKAQLKNWISSVGKQAESDDIAALREQCAKLYNEWRESQQEEQEEE